MVERAGCASGCRGHGSRKFNGTLYNVFKVYVMSQDYGMNHDRYEILKAENTALMERDRDALKKRGLKIRVLHEDLGSIHILYYAHGGPR